MKNNLDFQIDNFQERILSCGINGYAHKSHYSTLFLYTVPGKNKSGYGEGPGFHYENRPNTAPSGEPVHQVKRRFFSR